MVASEIGESKCPVQIANIVRVGLKNNVNTGSCLCELHSEANICAITARIRTHDNEYFEESADNVYCFLRNTGLVQCNKLALIDNCTEVSKPCNPIVRKKRPHLRATVDVYPPGRRRYRTLVLTSFGPIICICPRLLT